MIELKNYVNIFVLGMVFLVGISCSENEKFMEEIITTSITDDLEPDTSETILTKSEAVALAVQKKGNL